MGPPCLGAATVLPNDESRCRLAGTAQLDAAGYVHEESEKEEERGGSRVRGDFGRADFHCEAPQLHFVE